jgi:23S rRNA pseudouridine2605 synthase
MPAKKTTAAKKTAPKKTGAKKTATKRTATKKASKMRLPEAVEPELKRDPEVGEEVGAAGLAALTAQEDPIGDETDGEAAVSGSRAEEAEADAQARADTEAEDDLKAEAEEEADEDAEPDGEAEEEAELAAEADSEEEIGEGAEGEAEPRPPAKLERLQKILAQAGIASRRAAEKMIEEGRVQVNGKVVTELGTKADGGRDHIRVDGKLLHGAERLRYFVLNKPRGFVTTVKDPEGRPTVMQFFEKMRERLYPVGRLDYLSEGLLLVTNDGELANRLTKASLGVEKTYLVKVAGVPTEEELDRLRAGVAIDKGKPGDGRVRTSPARIRQVKHGDNPWYEVVLVEGRNRELRKMFEEIGHFVEKIRRVGYGPLVLDQEPGKLRELDEHELMLLRRAADGTLRTARTKAAAKVKFEDSLPPEKPAFRPRVAKAGTWKKDAGKKAFGGGAPQRRPASSKPYNTGTGDGGSFEPKPFVKPAESKTFEARPFARGGEGRSFAGKTFDKRGPFGAGKPAFGRSADRPGQSAGAMPAWKRDDRGGQDSRPGRDTGTGRPPQRFGAGAAGTGASGTGSAGEGQRPSRPFAGQPFGDRPSGGRTFEKKPAFGRPFASKPFAGKPAEGLSFGDRPRAGSFGDKPRGGGFGERPAGRGFGAKPAGGGSFGAKPAWKKPGERPSGGFDRKAGGSDRPPFKRDFKPRPRAAREDDEPMSFEPRKPSRLKIEPVAHTERRDESRPGGSRSSGARPERSGGSRDFKPRPYAPRPDGGRAGDGRTSGGGARFGGRTSGGRPSGGGRPSFGQDSGSRSAAPRPFRAEGGLPRAASTSSGKPRAGGPRPSSRPGKPAGAGWKPKPGGRPGGKPGFKSGFKSGPRPGGFKGKPGGKPRG